MEPAELPFRLIKEITDGFSEGRLLGIGSYGSVYKGTHKNGDEVAVKTLYYNLEDEQFKELRNHMRLDHPNIVRVVGYCDETQHKQVNYNGKFVLAEVRHRVLCLEYMHNGSLQNHLSDFGVSPFGQTQTVATRGPIGTIGYMAPECLVEGVISEKGDIYSLGVVMIKIIAGPEGRAKSAEMPPQEFIDQVQANWQNRLQTRWRGSWLDAYCQQVKICTEIALKCMEFDRAKRPPMSAIIHRLNEMETMIEELKNEAESPLDKEG